MWLVFSAVAGLAARDWEDRGIAVLQGLDKVTARTRTLEIEVGEAATLGTFTIRVRSCHKSPPIDPPEAAVFLEVDDDRPGGPVRRVFSGWMFASSPSLSAIAHPVYDLWLVDCKNASTSDKGHSPANRAGTAIAAASNRL